MMVLMMIVNIKHTLRLKCFSVLAVENVASLLVSGFWSETEMQLGAHALDLSFYMVIKIYWGL